jgi:hypothetical protein
LRKPSGTWLITHEHYSVPFYMDVALIELMTPPTENIAVVRRLYEARGNPEIVRQVLAPDVRWDVVEGFPHSSVYLGLAGVGDFSLVYSRTLRIGTPSRRNFLKRTTGSLPSAPTPRAPRPRAGLSKRDSLISGLCARVLSFACSSALTQCSSPALSNLDQIVASNRE